jgi:ribonuclease D
VNETPLVMIEDAEGLDAALPALREGQVLGVDTEADSMHRYREKCCLIQISDAHRDYVVDPLAGFDLSPLGEILANPDVVKIFHGADYDVVSLKRDFDWQITNVFDTMIAAQLLSRPRVGLADLVNDFFGYELEKKYQTHDWARRPLLDEHVAYARGDTHFLLAIRELFMRQLDRKGVWDIALEEFQLIEAREWGGPVHNEASFLRVKGSNKLDDTGKRVLRAVWEYRDGHAARLDRPPYKVIPDQVLLKLAERKPSSVGRLDSVMRSGSTMARRYGPDLVAAVEAGLADERPIPEVAKKERVGTRPRHGARETDRLFLILKEWRNKLAKSGTPLVMIGNNGQLKAIAGFRPTSLEELSGLVEVRQWQVRRYGEKLLQIVADFEAGLPPRTGGDKREGGGGRRRRSRRKAE